MSGFIEFHSCCAFQLLQYMYLVRLGGLESYLLAQALTLVAQNILCMSSNLIRHIKYD